MEKVQAALEPYLHQLRTHLDPHLEELKTHARPLTDQLPPGAQHFLDQGGWYLILLAAVLIFLLWVYSIVRRVARALFGSGKSKTPRWARELQEDLADYPLPSEPFGDKRLLVKGVPARVRLLVMAPAGKNLDLNATQAEQLLEWLVPGLGEIGMADDPKIRIWPAQYSFEGFATAFLHHTRSPDAPGKLSTWVLIAGAAKMGKQHIHVGLALWTAKPTSLGRIKLKSGHWLDLLRVQETKG